MSAKNNFNQQLDSIEVIEEQEIVIDGTEGGFIEVYGDSEEAVSGSLSGSTTLEVDYYSALEDIIGLFRVNAIIMTLLILTLVVSSACKFILQTKKIEIKKLYIYEVIAFLVILFLVSISTTLAFSPGALSYILVLMQYFILGCPIVITILEMIKSKKSN